MNKNRLRKFYWTIQLILAVAFNIWGQQQVLKGDVIDAQTGTPVAFAVVYVNNTAISTETSSEGNYLLKNIFKHIQGGSVEVVVSSLGYTTFRQKVANNQEDTLILNIALASNPQHVIAEVSVKGKRDKQWERQYRRFEDAFLGTNENARKSKILNPWVVNFDGEVNEFTASASQILEVENKPLGYKIFFELQRFSLSPLRSSFAGLARFEELKIIDDKDKVEKQRQNTYDGSERHFFKALAQNNLKKEGFVVYKVNPNYHEKTSFSHLNPQLGKRLLPFNDTLAIKSGRFPTSKEIFVQQELEILNINTVSRLGTYQDAPFPVSWLSIRGGKVEVTNTGLLFDTNICEWAGDIAQRRLSNMLPLDYEPKPLTENEKLLLPNNTQLPQLVFEPALAPSVKVIHHFEGDSVVFLIKVKMPDGTPVRGRLSVAMIEDMNPDPVNKDTLSNKNVDSDTLNLKKDKNAITLEEVKIKVKRDKTSSQTLLGRVDYVVENKDLKDIISGNIITVLQNKVPGLEIYETTDNAGFSRKGVRIRGGSYSLRAATSVEDEPLFLLDGIPYGTLQNLKDIPISEVLRIEVIKSANSLLGSRGKNGAINVVTKRANNNANSSAVSVNEGKLFFWQPSSELSPEGEVTVRFLLPRGIKYYVTINGISTENQPFTYNLRVF